MKFWVGILLFCTVALQGPSLLEGENVDPTAKERLRCYVCLSHISWEDCNEKSRLDPCPSSNDDACLKIRVDKWEIKNKTKTGRVLTHYAKYCSPGEYCSDKQCKDMGWKCKVDCCNQDMCNASVAISANIQLIAAVLCLVAHNILNAF